MATLTVSEGKKVYYESYVGSRLTVILIHGWGMSGRVWDRTLVTLRAEGYGVVTFDHRGCGLSDKDFGTVRIADLAADTAAIVETLGLDRVVLNGWSLGGAVAVEAAQLLGDKCAGLVLTCAASPRYVQAPDFPHGATHDNVKTTVAALSANRPAFLRGIANATCAGKFDPAVVEWLWSIFMQTGPSVDTALLELLKVEQRAALTSLDIPMLIFGGGRDEFVCVDIARSAARLARDARLVVYETCGHLPFLEEAEKYHAELLSYLSVIAAR
jgi:non-heme chloroperoxidase